MAGIRLDSASGESAAMQKLHREFKKDTKKKKARLLADMSRTFTHALNEWNEREEEREDRTLEGIKVSSWIFSTVTSSHDLLRYERFDPMLRWLGERTRDEILQSARLTPVKSVKQCKRMGFYKSVCRNPQEANCPMKIPDQTWEVAANEKTTWGEKKGRDRCFYRR